MSFTFLTSTDKNRIKWNRRVREQKIDGNMYVHKSMKLK